MTETELHIRPVNEMDAAAIESIDERLLGTYRPDHWENQIRYYLTRDPESALVAERDGKVVGFLFGDIRGWEFGFATPTGWIEVLGVDPDYQGQRIGKRLGEALFGHWRSQGVKMVRTLVHRKDEQIAAYMGSLGLLAAPITAYERQL